MDQAAALDKAPGGGSWALWKRIAVGRPSFGNPSVFADHVKQSKWVSFTTTLHDPILTKVVRDLTGNVPGEGGLITFPDSNWLMSYQILLMPTLPGFPNRRVSDSIASA